MPHLHMPSPGAWIAPIGLTKAVIKRNTSNTTSAGAKIFPTLSTIFAGYIENNAVITKKKKTKYN